MLIHRGVYSRRGGGSSWRASRAALVAAPTSSPSVRTRKDNFMDPDHPRGISIPLELQGYQAYGAQLRQRWRVPVQLQPQTWALGCWGVVSRLHQACCLLWPTSLAGCRQDKGSPWPWARIRAGSAGGCCPWAHCGPVTAAVGGQGTCSAWRSLDRDPACPLGLQGSLQRKGNFRKMCILRPEETILII